MTDKSRLNEHVQLLLNNPGFLERVMRCPLCLNLAELPVEQCSNGHVTCRTCAHQLVTRQCFTCLAPFEKNLLRGELVSCKYSESGCQEVFPSRNKEHEDFCGFRPITCRVCKDKVPVQQMREHYEQKHPESSILTEKQQDVSLADFNPRKGRAFWAPLFFGGHFFYISFYNDVRSRNLEIVCEAFYTGKTANDYYVSLRFEIEEFVQQNTIQAVTMKGESKRDGFERISTTRNPKEFCMFVPQRFLFPFLTEDQKLLFSYSIFTVVEGHPF